LLQIFSRGNRLPALDFEKAPAQKQSQVSRVTAQPRPSTESVYARWRWRGGAALALSEDRDHPPERLLQAIWQHQRLRREQLATLDGEPVRVLHPGFASVEGGPDFRGAVLQIGDAAPQSGDVEVDLRPAGWRAHGHDRNPAFANVRLHVVWQAERAPADGPKVLALHRSLDAPLSELGQWLEREPVKALPAELRGRCSAPLAELSREQIAALLNEAARVRFEARAAQLRARARHAGWEQALWEGLFRALGYKHNVWPMHCLAESRARWARAPAPPLVLQARLLGVSGLLPAELPRPAAGAEGYVRRVWDCWWREREEFSDVLLPRSVWRFHGLRPANHPERRLALAAHWLAAAELPARLERWCAQSLADGELESSLQEILQGEPDDFWSWHWTLRSARLKQARPLLGTTRATDLAINVVLPWLWTRAAEGGNEPLCAELERRYFAWPAAEDNAVLRLARQRLLGGAAPYRFRQAAAQQGLMQIVRDFCDHSNAVCEQCGFPELVKQWPR
jgi:hypothetical protein